MRRILFFIIFFITFAFTACESDISKGDLSGDMSSHYEFADAALEKDADNNETTIDKKLIKDGRLTFETSDLQKTRTLIANVVQKYDAYIASDQQFSYETRTSNDITIRIPEKNFDKVLKEITDEVSDFDVKDITIKDVTEEFLDVEARLKTKKELENRYIEILKKANLVTEILEVEREIGDLRSEIESIEGRLKYLSNQVAFSTLKITFYQKITESTQFGNKFKSGLKNGWENLIWVLVFLTNLWPFILLAILTIVIFKYFRKRRKK